MVMVLQRTPAYSYARSEARLRSSPIDHWCLSIPRSGHSWTEVEGNVAAAGPEMAEIRSLGRAFRGRTTGSEKMEIYFPRDAFVESNTILDARNNSVLSGNSAHLLVGYLNSVEHRLSNLATEDLPRIAQAVREMLIACLSPGGDNEPANEEKANPALMERARRYVQSNLSASELPDAMCRALGVSRTRLYQLFEASGGVSHYIQRTRLLTAHAALSDPADRRRIVDIAEAVGFTSAANFSRAFSSEFGYSPREARSLVRQPESGHASSAGQASFEGWLRALGS